MLSKNLRFVSKVEEWKLRNLPPQDPVLWNLEPWVSALPQFTEFLKSLAAQNLGYIDRNLVKKIIQHNFLSNKIVDGFLASLVWGYSSDPRGPFRASRILSDSNIEQIIRKTINFLDKGDINNAYKQLVEHGPKFLGPAFATKYLYFAARDGMNPKPVILDSLISLSLEAWGNYRINSQNAKAANYVDFLDYMKKNADDLNVSVEDLELILFSEQARQKKSLTWIPRRSNTKFSQSERMAWGFLLAGEILMRTNEYFLSFEQPGGGQYNCLALRRLSGNDDSVLNINLSGTIQFHGKKPIHFDWEDLYNQGAVYAAEVLSNSLEINPEINKTEIPIHGNSVRAIASFLIQNHQLRKSTLSPLLCDNSVYGVLKLDGNSRIFKSYIDSAEGYPKIFGKPKETWFWQIQNEQNLFMIDTHKGLRIDANNQISNFRFV